MVTDVVETGTKAAPYTDDALLGVDLFGCDKDDGGARMASSRIVTTRRLHTCRYAEPHDIPAGTRARLEKAIIDDRWGQFYVCSDCLVQDLREWDVLVPVVTDEPKES